MSHVLLTGFPGSELACRVFSQLLVSDASLQLTCLVPASFMERARALVEAELPDDGERVSLLEGDVASLDLGLSGVEYLELAARVQVVHHCAAVTYTGAQLGMAERVNVRGTGEVMELARAARKLERVVHWSTTSATKAVNGVVREDQLVEPSSGPLILTRYRAEKVVARARRHVPITVLRLAMLTGDSRTGALARVEGAQLLVSALLATPGEFAPPRLGNDDARLQVIPIDYAVTAGLAIARAPDTTTRTFHIVDHDPPTLHDALALIARYAGRPAPRGGLPPGLTRALLRIPLVDKLVHAERALFDELAQDVRYDDTNARPVLERARVTCPAFASYVDKLVAHVRERRSERPSEIPAPAAHS